MGYDLERFVRAQEQDYDQALTEMRAGRKRSHWIWYIFPQLKGLGFSANANYYGIDDLDEAIAYLQHAMLGPRLIAISRALLKHTALSATTIMGSPDDVKLQSSMTLFSLVPGADPIFEEVLQLLYKGEKDPQTVEMIKQS